LTSLPKGTDTKDSLAAKAVEMIGKLYGVESMLNEKYDNYFDDLALADIYQARQEQSKPVCDEYFSWCKTNRSRTTGSLRKAIDYSLNEEKKLRVFLDNPICEIDNNRAERSIKPYVMGRKAWLFSGSAHGAESSAMIYSLIITAKENKLKIYDYLVYLFNHLAASKGDIDLIDLEYLMPWSETLPEQLRVRR
jgi:hypothetical protein